MTFHSAQAQGLPSATRILRGPEDSRPSGVEKMLYIATDTGHNFYYLNGAWTVLSIGTDRCTYGPFTDVNYWFSSTTGSTVGPQFVNPYTLAIGFYVSSLPGTNQHQMLAFSNTGATTGWNFGASGSTSNKFAMSLRGASPVTTEFTGMAALTTGAHAIAIKYDGANLSYSYDGAAVTNSGVTGVTAAGGGDKLYIGRWLNTSLPCDFASIGWIRGFASAVSDANLQLLSGSPSTYLPVPIGLAPAYDWQMRWYLNDAISSTPLGNVASQNLTLNGTTASQLKINR